MTPAAITLALRALVGGLVAAAFLILLPRQRVLVVDVYLLFLGGLVLLALVDATRRVDRRPSPFERALRRTPPAGERLLDLTPLEDKIALAMSSAGDLHFRLRPMLREIAEHRLLVHHGVELDARPEQARETLGEEVWELVRPDREPPRDRYGPGLPARRLRAVVDVLERI